MSLKAKAAAVFLSLSTLPGCAGGHIKFEPPGKHCFPFCVGGTIGGTREEPEDVPQQDEEANSELSTETTLGL